ncbi:SOS response-associated peptidase family protein [Bowmanella sp. Y26]|uniref:SOS response-associated peptidase family protein n=1 Tax=Bowmanella yangjiangensis TaxID=2811230 RepID=UPI001BDCA9A2|nr:SOS response-associated peptidase family protein [Bowmanella yangjiangensis]MBT1066022.1 SOS response-associated peptidase family protein [Bowmanella yangjiangensis]
MCGRLNITDDPFVVGLCEALGVKLFPDRQTSEIKCLPDGRPIPWYFNRFIRATEPVGIIREVEGKRILALATWWLLLEHRPGGFKPSKYTSFNTRYDKLNDPKSAGYKAFRQSRCIVPVTGFGETQGKGDNAIYTDFVAANGALALGGLCREWQHFATGERALSCSIITLGLHNKLLPFHEKSMPLILNQADGSMDLWLDCRQTDVSVFDILLQPFLPQDLLAQRVDKPSNHQPIGKPIAVIADIASAPKTQ